MENILRFSEVGQKILKNLDAKSLVQSKEASRGIDGFLENEKFYFISIIKNYNGYFEGFEKSWVEVIHRTPIQIIKQLAIAVQKHFKKDSNDYYVPPLAIAGDGDNIDIELCKYIISKTSNKNPTIKSCYSGKTFPQPQFFIQLQLEKCKLIVEEVEWMEKYNKNLLELKSTYTRKLIQIKMKHDFF